MQGEYLKAGSGVDLWSTPYAPQQMRRSPYLIYEQINYPDNLSYLTQTWLKSFNNYFFVALITITAK